MKTLFLNADNTQNIQLCASIIKNGGLCAFPTETVYGLGANGFNTDAVNAIFAAKGRPNDNPLILHVSSIRQAEELYSDIPQSFYSLAQVFWPAPLTIICKKAACVPDAVTAGLNTVAVRMPSNEYARKLIELSNLPIAAPSANLSGKPSPTAAAHVLNDMNGKIDAILDGGPCRYGVESTVISLVGTPTILRPGSITQKMLSTVLGKVELAKSITSPLKNGETALSPGMKYKHYSPDAQVIAFEGNASEIADKICKAYDEAICCNKHAVILASEENKSIYEGREIAVIGRRSNPVSFCSNLFNELRTYNNYDLILCEALPPNDEGLAYMNRLLRACSFKVY